jgi:hypothetical protein
MIGSLSLASVSGRGPSNSSLLNSSLYAYSDTADWDCESETTMHSEGFNELRLDDVDEDEEMMDEEEDDVYHCLSYSE